MKLSELLQAIQPSQRGNFWNEEVSGVIQDSRQAGAGKIFVAIKGNASDGHQFIPQVAAAGVAAIVCEDDSRIPASFQGAIAKVGSSRLALESLAMKFFGEPANKLFCIGVTGTNGKTTITYMIEKILNHYGWPTGVIGTIDHHLKTRKWESQLTTPDPLTLHRRLKEFVELGAKAAAFEVSSHALSQSRAESLPFKVGVFTNFTRDHLDYHQTMENYFAAKERLFAELLGKDGGPAFAILNGDDPWIRKTRVNKSVTTWWYGKSNSDFTFEILKQDLDGSVFRVQTPKGNIEIKLPCTGEHNIYNAVAALAASVAAGCPLKTASEALSGFHGAPGRLEKVPNDRGLHIFVDYAHTDDAVRTVLRALKTLRDQAHSDSRIITVFGCGGDRDKGKRPLMAKAASENSDVVLITSDNPRTEDPGQIISEIKTGIPAGWSGKLLIEADRKKALAEALQTARQGDVILIAGKGHEDYQIIGKQKLSFSDVNVVSELLNG